MLRGVTKKLESFLLMLIVLCLERAWGRKILFVSPQGCCTQSVALFSKQEQIKENKD